MAKVQVFFHVAVTREIDLEHYRKAKNYAQAAREDIQDIFDGAQTVEEGLGILDQDGLEITVHSVKVLD